MHIFRVVHTKNHKSVLKFDGGVGKSPLFKAAHSLLLVRRKSEIENLVLNGILNRILNKSNTFNH